MSVRFLANPYLDVDKKVMAEVYTSSEPMDNLKVLCDVHGSRFPGSAGDRPSVDYMVKKLEEYGCANAHMEEFKIAGWTRGPATLEIVKPVKKCFDVISLPHSIGAEAEGKLVYLGDGAIDDYEKRKAEIDGNVLMVTSAMPRGMKRMLHRSEKYMRSVIAGAKGWIFMNHYPAYGPPTGGINPVIPAIGISYEDGSYLARLLEREKEVVARIKTTDRNHEVVTYNVVADVVPDNPVDDEYIIVGSHYDGHDISQGAVDPASGAVTVMEIARVLCKVKDKLKRRVRCICFGAEEIGLYGSYAYARDHAAELDKCRFMLNLDSGGSAGKKGVVFHDFPELEPLAEEWAKQMVAEVPTDQNVSPYSDHWPFFLKSVPCGSGGDPTQVRTGRGYGHTKYDTLDKVEMQYLHLAAANYTRFLYRVACEDEWSPKRKTQEEIQEFIKEKGYDKTVALADQVREYIKKNYKSIHPETKEWLDRGGAW
ncbi:MAG TPA: M28 family peptidase [Candidatus Desulfaltia sp.]|nr:M28 family peptidase [Candidatus Desulfaltia sp.]